jgi:mRNA interferase RelE/StbE
MIKRAIEERLATQPETYGKPLQRTLKGYWKVRIGDYRVFLKLIMSVFHLWYNSQKRSLQAHQETDRNLEPTFSAT